jgi:peptidoglycan-associated lipoprotein
LALQVKHQQKNWILLADGLFYISARANNSGCAIIFSK